MKSNILLNQFMMTIIFFNKNEIKAGLSTKLKLALISMVSDHQKKKHEQLIKLFQLIQFTEAIKFIILKYFQKSENIKLKIKNKNVYN